MEELAAMATDFDLQLTPAQLVQFKRYEALLLDWSQRLNLTSLREPSLIRLRHFLDSLSVATVTGDLNGSTMVDVGAGAGFPGLPLKVLYPGLKLTLVESTGKKARFLEAVCAELELQGVTILSERAELVGHHEMHRERYDWAVARGVAEMRILVEYLLPLCRQGGFAVAQKGQDARREVAEANSAIELLGGRLARLQAVQLPGLPQLHYLVLVGKEKVTPEKYPRRPGIPTKRPL